MMKQYGLIKTIDGIKLSATAMTFILYKSYFGRDLLSDIVGFAGKFSKSPITSKTTEAEILANINMGEIEFDSEFLLNFIASLIATAQYPNKPDVADLILSIPPYWIADKDIIADLMDFLSLFISSKKVTARKGNGL